MMSFQNESIRVPSPKSAFFEICCQKYAVGILHIFHRFEMPVSSIGSKSLKRENLAILLFISDVIFKNLLSVFICHE